MATVIALTLIVIGATYVRFVKKATVPVPDTHLSGIGKLLSNKYYVDEIYDFVIAKPLRWTSKLSDEVIEKLGIDGIVNSIGQLVTSGSTVLRRLQNGSIGFYIFIMVISIIVILAFSTVTGIGG
jgi:NADH-quinone oxidoreductase subunit L